MKRSFGLAGVARLVVASGLAVMLLVIGINSVIQAKVADDSTTVLITQEGFSPSVVTVNVGTKVSWENRTQEVVHLKSGSPIRVFLPLSIKAGSSIGVKVPPQFPPASHAKDQNDWVDEDLAAGQSYFHTFEAVGDYALYLTGQPDATGMVRVVAPTPDFMLGVVPGSQSIKQGQAATYSVALTATHGYSSPVALTISGLPLGAASSWSANTVTPPGSSALMVTTTLATPVGMHKLSVIGEGDGKKHMASINLDVKSGMVEPAPDFMLGVVPGSQSIVQGQQATYSVAVTETNGFSTPVAFSVSGLPTGATSSWSKNPATPTDSTNLTISTALDTPTGTHNLTISGDGGGQSHDAQMSLTVEAAPPPPLFESVLSVITETGYMTASHSVSLNLGTGDGEDFTIESHFYVANTDYDPVYVDILARKDQSYAIYVKYNSGSPDWLTFKLWRKFDTAVVLNYQSDLAVGWHHVAAVFDNEYTDSEDSMAIYLDESRVAFSPDGSSHPDWTPGILASSYELEIGGAKLGSAGFNDLIEEMRFSDIARYSGTSYSKPTAPFSNDANTRALWHFDEPTGSSTFFDDSGQSNHLTGHEAQTHKP